MEMGHRGVTATGDEDEWCFGGLILTQPESVPGEGVVLGCGCRGCLQWQIRSHDGKQRRLPWWCEVWMERGRLGRYEEVVDRQ